ncbi:MAG TPA: hypothetical protein VMR41_05970 [Patescibacteria group bacterium]|nr:hypothetical protein [Patescibacteria group bacterium]
MAKYELSKDWSSKNSEKVKEAYLLVTDPKHKYSVESVDDVLKILIIVDPLNANEENAEIFSKMLQLFTKQMKKKFAAPDKTKTKIIN